MSFVCPHCGDPVSRWESLRLLRMVTVECPSCSRRASIDRTGRAALYLTVLGSLPLGGILSQLLGFVGVLWLTIIAGLVAACFLTPFYGRLEISDEE